MSNSIKFTKIYDHPIEKVWQALTSREALSAWLMPCDFVPRVGHEFQFCTRPYPGFDGITHCKVLVLKDREILSFSWRGGQLDSVVTFRLTAQGQSTRLDFEHSGFEGLLNRLIVKRILGSGWKGKLLSVNLPKYLAQ